MEIVHEETNYKDKQPNPKDGLETCPVCGQTGKLIIFPSTGAKVYVHRTQRAWLKSTRAELLRSNEIVLEAHGED